VQSVSSESLHHLANDFAARTRFTNECYRLQQSLPGRQSSAQVKLRFHTLVPELLPCFAHVRLAAPA
jgi:hypothetical protein